MLSGVWLERPPSPVFFRSVVPHASFGVISMGALYQKPRLHYDAPHTTPKGDGMRGLGSQSGVASSELDTCVRETVTCVGGHFCHATGRIVHFYLVSTLGSHHIRHCQRGEGWCVGKDPAPSICQIPEPDASASAWTHLESLGSMYGARESR